MFEDVIIIFCTHVFAFWLGYKWGIHSAVIRLITNYMNNPKDIQHAFKQLGDLKEDSEEVVSDEIEIEAHVEGRQVYLWRKDTNQFLAQGNSIDEAIVAISQQHQGQYRIDKETVDKIRAELPKNL